MNDLIQLTHGWRMRIAATAIPGIFSVGFVMGFIYTSKQAVDVATGASEGAFWPLVYLLILFLFLQLALTPISRRLSINLRTSMAISLRARLFNRLLMSRWRQTERFAAGDIDARLATDVDEVTTVLASTLPGVVRTSTELIVSFLFLFALQPILAVSVIAISPLFLLIGRQWHRRVGRLTRRIKHAENDLLAFLHEQIEHRTLLKTLEAVPRRQSELGSMQRRMRRLVRRRERFSTHTRTAVELMFATGYLAAFIWGAAGLRTGAVSFGALAAFLQLVGRIQGPLLGLARSVPSFASTTYAAKRLNELLRLDGESTADTASLQGELTIRINHVTAGYDVKHPVIEGLSMQINPHTITAIIGPTGIGKTTMLRLLLGLIDPFEGEIRLVASSPSDSEPTAAASLPVSSQTRRYFAYAPQENPLMSGTIRDNLLLARPDASDTELREAITLAEADFVFNLPRGLATRLDEHGGGLSQGQLQRLNIARTLLRQTPILILDEPTSSLDAVTERHLFENLRHLRSGHTIVIITHRPELAAACDVVYSLDGQYVATSLN